MYQFTACQWYHLLELEKQDKVQNASRPAEQPTEIRDISEWEADKSYLATGRGPLQGNREARDFGDCVGVEQ